jgi:hypothetical protein
MNIGGLVGGAVGGPPGAAIGDVLGGAMGNLFQSYMGNKQADAATAGNTQKQQALFEFAKQNSMDMKELATHAQNLAQQDAQFQQGMTQNMLPFVQKLQQDQGRANTYNQMALGEQANRAAAANNLMQNYTQARQANQGFLSSLANTRF